ncbi:SH3 domain-containing protein [Spirochaetota bacterium]
MLFFSCSTKEGWGLILWPRDDSKLNFGTIAAVHFKSSITKTWAVAVPGSKAKEEVDLWRLELYKTKKKAMEALDSNKENVDLMALALRDGLVMRSKPENTADQVYRLRLDQDVKLLHKVEGAAVETGGKELEGDWYLAIAEDGTRGYIFSNQLALYHAQNEKRPKIDKSSVDSSVGLSALFDNVWRPDYFNSMVESGIMDLSAYQARYGIFTDPQRLIIRVERPGFSKIYRYESINQLADGTFEIIPGSASFVFTKAGSLLFTPSQSEVPQEALKKIREAEGPDAKLSYEFVLHDKDVISVINAEERKRLAKLADFLAWGDRYESELYGILIITRSGRFTWISYGTLSPYVIPEDAGEVGSISMDLYLSEDSYKLWDGAFSLVFDGPKRPKISFVYKLGDEQLVLGLVPKEAVSMAVVNAMDIEELASFHIMK